MKKWFKSFKPYQQLIIVWFCCCLYWGFFTVIQRWMNSKPDLFNLKEFVFEGLFMGTLTTPFFSWKLVKKVFTKTKNVDENIESIE